MSKKYDSRGYDINTEKVVEICGGNRFDAVLIATARARELARRDNNTSPHYEHRPVTALLDLQNGTIDPIEYYKKIR